MAKLLSSLPAGGTDLGSVTDNTSILKYTPIDCPVGTTVTEKINGVTVGTKTVISGTEYTVSATTAQWNAVKFGKYKDMLGNKNVVTLEFSTGEVYTYPFTKVLPTTAKTDDVLVAVNDMSNTAMTSHKKKLMNAIGNKATVGGAGTLEDIAKAIEGISVDSLGGAKFAKGLTQVISSGIPGMPTGLSDRKVKVTGLSFTPDLVIVTNESNKGSDRSPIIYRRKLGMLNTYYNLYSAENQSTTYAAKINEVPNGFELPIRVFGYTNQRWIAFGFEDF